MTTWIAWAVFAGIALALGFTGYHFTVRTVWNGPTTGSRATLTSAPLGQAPDRYRAFAKFLADQRLPDYPEHYPEPDGTG